MKLTNLIWVLALAGTVAACNSGPPVTGEVEPPPPVGGNGGSCDPGGGDGACTNAEDAAVYEDLTYTDDAGNDFEGTDAASAIGSDCIFGQTQSEPLLEGCNDQARTILSCFNLPDGCDDDDILALADCVAQCTQDATGLSEECMACTGDTVACGAAFCTGECVNGTDLPECIACRCNNGCIQEFDACSGLPSDCECE
jgi:hypothetical protein